ncbi:MAG: 6-phospho-beta-glucosidase, partial [Deltaproteobacteria bacterium]|nr:6-phospho-beta-glucosidase [Deltaproteobacteria bacterium]
RLPLMTRLGKRMVGEARTNLVITSTTDLSQALEGATFVLTNFRPGGMQGLRLDEIIPIKYNILGQETTGPGGTFFALRSIPEVLHLCKYMEDVCPEAWMINYVNPANFVADAVRRESKIKCIAICDGGGNNLRYSLPEMLG